MFTSESTITTGPTMTIIWRLTPVTHTISMTTRNMVTTGTQGMIRITAVKRSGMGTITTMKTSPVTLTVIRTGMDPGMGTNMSMLTEGRFRKFAS